MSLLKNLDIIIFCFAILLISVIIFLLFFRRYEIIIILVLISSWIHWFFIPNDPISSGFAYTSYIRVSFILFSGIIGYIYFIKLKFRSRNYEEFPFYLILFLLFLLLASISTTYSIYKTRTLITTSEFILFFGFLLGFYYWLKDGSRINKTLNIYFIVLTIGILINLISWKLFPDRVWWWKSPSRFQGVVGHPNGLGGLCMIYYPVLLWKYNCSNSIRKPWIVLLFCITLFMHILTGSRATLLSSIFGYFVFQLVLNRKGKIFFLLGIFSVIVFLFSDVRISSFERQSESVLMGREYMWEGALLLISEKPLSGYGYGVGGEVFRDKSFFDNYVDWRIDKSLHQGYLEIAIGVGITGLVLWLIFVITPIWRLISFRIRDYRAAIVMAIIFQSFLISFFESAITGSSSFTSIAFWLFWIIAGRLPYILNLEGKEVEIEKSVAISGQRSAVS